MADTKIKEKLKGALDGSKLKNLAVLAGILGLALIFLSNRFDTGSFGAKEASAEFSVAEYCEKTQSNLEEMISSIRGAGKTRVLLTMENSVEYVYLKDSSTKTKEVEPHIRGVLVVCEGGDDPVAVERITLAVTKSLGISTARICIAKLSE